MLDGTKTDPDGDWNIVDGVICLRYWAAERTIDLPSDPFAEKVLGAAPTCSLPLDDTTRRISREHAKLVHRGAMWTIHDLASKNGTWIDGVKRVVSALTPGTEIRLGGVVLVAESHELAALRALLCRWIGWSADRRADVDRALRATREAFAARMPLLLCGEGDLSHVAARLHRQTLGDRPFELLDRVAGLRAAITRATRGTLCISSEPKPHTVASALVSVRAELQHLRLIVCSPTPDRAAALATRLGETVRIVLPSIAERRHELARILREYALDAQASFGAVAILDAEDIAILARQPYGSLAEIEDDTRRLAALRALGIRPGARALGLSHGAFSRWASRRRLRV